MGGWVYQGTMQVSLKSWPHLSRNGLLRNQGCRQMHKPDVAPMKQQQRGEVQTNTYHIRSRLIWQQGRGRALRNQGVSKGKASSSSWWHTYPPPLQQGRGRVLRNQGVSKGGGPHHRRRGAVWSNLCRERVSEEERSPKSLQALNEENVRTELVSCV